MCQEWIKYVHTAITAYKSFFQPQLNYSKLLIVQNPYSYKQHKTFI